MLQTVWKWTQINQGQLGEPFGSTSGFIDQFGEPLDGSKAKFRPFWGATQCHGALGSIRRCGKAALPLLAFLAFFPTSLPSNT